MRLDHFKVEGGNPIEKEIDSQQNRLAHPVDSLSSV